MKLTLTITASAAALANILSMIESDDGEDAVKLVHSGTFPAPDMPALPVFPSSNPVMPEVAAVAPTVPAAAGAPEFDSTGLAWDERIHSKQKGQTNDGKWRKQRGVDDAFYNAVEAELRALYGNAAAGNAPTMQPVMAMPSIEPVATVLGAVAVEPVASEPVMMQQPVAPQPVAIPMPVAVAPQPVAVPVPMPVAVAAPVPAANEPVTFHTVMTHVGAAMGAGTMTPDYLVGLVTEINQQCGLAMQSFTDMAAFPNAVTYCWAAFARDGKL